jgi:hypothetical protein
MQSLTIDQDGNLYAAVDVLGDEARILEWFGGSGDAFDLGIRLEASGGIESTADGGLIACDGLRNICGVFKRGSTTMSDTFVITGASSVQNLAVEATGHKVFVAASGFVSAWKWPHPGPNPLQIISLDGGDDDHGTAVSPALAPGKPFRTQR